MKAFDYSLVKDPQYFCDNRMEAHSDHVYYRDGNEMQTAVQDGTETSFSLQSERFMEVSLCA